jgi:hypothetical protein
VEENEAYPAAQALGDDDEEGNQFPYDNPFQRQY